MCCFTILAQKTVNSHCFYLISNCWKKSNYGVQEGNHVWWRHRPPAAPPPMKYPSSCREDQRLSTEGKIVSKYCNILKNSRGEGGGPSTPPSLPLYHVGNTSLRVRPKQICVFSFLYSYKDDLLENLGKIKPVSKNAKNRRPAWSVKKAKDKWTIETFFVNVFLHPLWNPRQGKNKPFIGLQLVVMWFIPLVLLFLTLILPKKISRVN